MACDDLIADPNLSDQCIFISDGPGATWWMSPDINLNNFTDVANVGQNNTVDVTVRRGADNEKCSQLAASSNIIVEVWVSPGGLNLSPLGASHIGTKLIPKAQLPPNGTRKLSQAGQTVTWTPTSTNPSDPDGPGHRCLIARCYPETDGPPQADCFHVVGDAHVAQRNIEIVTVSPREPRIRTEIRTINPDDQQPQLATFRVETDTSPDKRVLDVLAPGLNNTGVFKRVATARPSGFGLQLPDFPSATVRDNTKPGCLKGLLGGGGFAPSYEADVKMSPGQTTQLNFETDLSRGQQGDAYIFYLTHKRSDGRVIGGLTFVAVMS